MKKKFRLLLSSLFLTAFLLGSGLSVNAQLFDKGDKVLSFGLGIGANYIGWGSYYKTTVPTLWVSGDYCLREKLGPGNLGVGGILAFAAYKYDWAYYDWGYKANSFFIGARGTYHFVDLVDKLDLYGAITLGAKIHSYSYYGGYEDESNLNNVDLLDEFIVGARYYFSDNFAVVGEVGYGIAWLKAGISLKL
jgi:hypothetical protein